MSKQANNTSKQMLFAPLAVGFFIGVLTVVGFEVIKGNDQGVRTYQVHQAAATVSSQAAPSTFDSKSFSSFNSTSSPADNPAVARIASHFTCACADHCGKQASVCSCPTSRKERAFLGKQLQQGHSEDEAAKALNQKFGGLKS